MSGVSFWLANYLYNTMHFVIYRDTDVHVPCVCYSVVWTRDYQAGSTTGGEYVCV